MHNQIEKSAPRYRYAGPFKHRDTAESVLGDLYASGEISAAEAPRVDTLRSHRGRVTGFQISLGE